MAEPGQARLWAPHGGLCSVTGSLLRVNNKLGGGTGWAKACCRLWYWQHLTPLKWNEPQHPTSCFLGSLTPPHTSRGTRCPQPTLYLGTWGSVQSPAVPGRGSVGDSSTQAGSGRGLRWAQLGLAPEEHFVCQWAEQKGKAKAEPGCNMKKQDEIPQAAWGCFHWRNPNDSIYAFQAGDFHFPGSCGMRQDPSLSQFAAPWCQGAWLFAGSSP